MTQAIEQSQIHLSLYVGKEVCVTFYNGYTKTGPVRAVGESYTIGSQNSFYEENGVCINPDSFKEGYSIKRITLLKAVTLIHWITDRPPTAEDADENLFVRVVIRDEEDNIKMLPEVMHWSTAAAKGMWWAHTANWLEKKADKIEALREAIRRMEARIETLNNLP